MRYFVILVILEFSKLTLDENKNTRTHYQNNYLFEIDIGNPCFSHSECVNKRKQKFQDTSNIKVILCLRLETNCDL